MNGLPFQLSPDPDFYFDSHGHHRALAALRRGLSEASGFTVISGDIGAGKTTAVRAVLRELKPEYFVVAQVVSTQLDAQELLRAISIGFGLPSAPGDALALTANLRRLFSQLRSQRRRAVLVVDEAQNLGSDALDQLVGLAMRGAPGGRCMQICLVGQPELQTMLAAPNLLAVREQVCVSCHLGPIEREETGPYVEHRLRKVGWKGGPTFDPGAIDEIYRWTGGIPRRINMLCSRAIAERAARHDDALIDAARVARVARDQREEIGDVAADPPLLPDWPTSAGARAAAPPRRPVLLIATCVADQVKAAALMAGVVERALPLPMKLVHVNDDAFALSAPLFDRLEPGQSSITMDRVDAATEVRHAELQKKFEGIVERASPKAVVVFSGGDAARGCALLARAKGLPVVRVGAGGPFDAAGTDVETIVGAADLWYPPDDRAARALVDHGVAADRVHCAGNLVRDAVQIAIQASQDPLHNGAFHRIVIPKLGEDDRYGLVLIEGAASVADLRSVVALLSFLRSVSRSTPLVLVLRSGAERAFDKHRLRQEIFGDRMIHLPAQVYANHVELVRHAACVLTDSPDVRLEAVVLGTPCLTLGLRASAAVPEEGGINPRIRPHASGWSVWPHPVGDDIPGPDASAGGRIAEHLYGWLRRSASRSGRPVTTGNRELRHISAPATPPPG